MAVVALMVGEIEIGPGSTTSVTFKLGALTKTSGAETILDWLRPLKKATRPITSIAKIATPTMRNAN